MVMEEQSLVRRAMAGDPAALDGLWREHRRWVGAVLLAHKPRDAALDDLLQEVALVLVERLAELRDPERLRPWLRAVAINAARTAARRRGARVGTTSLQLGNEPPAAPGPHPAETRDTLARVLTLARRLHEDYREPLLLRCLHGLSQSEIAQTLGLPETTVETRLARARRLLRAEMERSDPTSLPGRARTPSVKHVRAPLP